MPATLLTFPLFRPLDAGGRTMPGAKLFSYLAGTTTPQATYAESGAANPNPVVLDSAGIAHVRLGPLAYKLNLLDANNVQQPEWPVDNILEAATWPVLTATIASVDNAPTLSTLSTPAILPAGMLILRVTTSIVNVGGFGASRGLQGYAVGDGVIMDRWGQALTLGFGTTTGGSDAPPANQAHDTTFTSYTTNTPVIISALGGLFDGQGQLQVSIQYLDLHHRVS